MAGKRPTITALRLVVEPSRLETELKRIDEELQEKYASSCERAGWLRRWYLRWQWKQEREAQLERLLPRLPYFLGQRSAGETAGADRSSGRPGSRAAEVNLVKDENATGGQ